MSSAFFEGERERAIAMRRRSAGPCTSSRWSDNELCSLSDLPSSPPSHSQRHCRICLTLESNAVLLPCAHLCLCTACATQLFLLSSSSSPPRNIPAYALRTARLSPSRLGSALVGSAEEGGEVEPAELLRRGIAGLSLRGAEKEEEEREREETRKARLRRFEGSRGESEGDSSASSPDDGRRVMDDDDGAPLLPRCPLCRGRTVKFLRVYRG